MKISHLLASVVVAALATISPAGAATVDLSGANYDIGTIVAGQNGEINTDVTSWTDDSRYTMYAYVHGLLAPKTAVTFTYSTDGSGSLNSGSLVGESNLDGVFKLIRAESEGPSVLVSNPFGLVTVLADLEKADSKVGIVTITNLSTQAVNFATYALSRTGSFKGVYSTYGAVPLPGAVLLFGSGLAALAGVRKKRAIKA